MRASPGSDTSRLEGVQLPALYGVEAAYAAAGKINPPPQKASRLAAAKKKLRMDASSPVLGHVLDRRHRRGKVRIPEEKKAVPEVPQLSLQAGA